MQKLVLIKPIISEKSERLSDKLSQYSFVVHKKSNKVEIRKAVEKMYSVSVVSVNTINMPAKAKVRNTKSGMVKGRTSAFKKAIVTLADGEELDFFGDI